MPNRAYRQLIRAKKYCNTKMKMSPFTKMKMSPKDAIISSKKGGYYGKKGHCYDESKPAKTIACNWQGIKQATKTVWKQQIF
jgi:hypothetical protein